MAKLILLLVLLNVHVFAHEGHDFYNQAEDLIAFLGSFHVILLHFPIALIVMAGVAELLNVLTANEKYDFTIKFLLTAAAFFAIPTVISGLCYEEIMNFQDWEVAWIWWHKIFGLATLGLSVLSVILLHCFGRSAFYLASFLLQFFCVVITSYMGGVITFG